jgi:hypothetical protein
MTQTINLEFEFAENAPITTIVHTITDEDWQAFSESMYDQGISKCDWYDDRVCEWFERRYAEHYRAEATQRLMEISTNE